MKTPSQTQLYRYVLSSGLELNTYSTPTNPYAHLINQCLQ